MTRRGCVLLVTLAVALALGADHVSAQTAVCSNTPADDERIECMEDEDSTTSIVIDAVGVDVDTVDSSASNIRGIHAEHRGSGDIEIRVSDGSTVDTVGLWGDAILGRHWGSGDLDIHVSGSSTLGATGQYAIGAHAQHRGAGSIRVVVDDSTIIATGDGGFGVNAQHVYGGDGVYDLEFTVRDSHVRGEDEGLRSARERGRGDVRTRVERSTIETAGPAAMAIFANRITGAGDVDIDVVDSTITTQTGPHSHGIGGRNDGAIGDVDIDVVGGSITLQGVWSAGILASIFDSTIAGVEYKARGTVDIFARDVTIRTESTDLISSERPYTDSDGVVARHKGAGSVVIVLDGGSITTRGSRSNGVYGRKEDGDDGSVFVVTQGGHTITTTGERSHGIVAEHWPEGGNGRVDVTADHVEVSGASAWGIVIGNITTDGMAVREAGMGSDGFLLTDVRINGRVRGAAGGVFLAGGGHVYIGPAGSIGAASGIAILASGDLPGPEGGNPRKPRLSVNMELDGRRVADVISDGWIINDGGRTTIVVNGVVLHDAGGVTGRVAPNGARDITMRAEGVLVTDRTDPDPANWVVTAPAAGVVADRDFSVADFPRTSEPEPDPPGNPDPDPLDPVDPVDPVDLPKPTEPDPDPPGNPDPDPEPELPSDPSFTEEYAPRAALYELLPDFLLRLSGQGPSRSCRSTPDSPVWVRFAGGQGAYQADRSTTGARYDFDRFETESGLSASLNHKVKGWASVRYVRGMAGGTSTAGDGKIDARGWGSTVGGAWRGANGAYAVGCFAYMGYTLDFASTNRGPLRGGVNGRAYTLDLEAGRRLAMGEQVHVTPRVWVVGSRVSMDSFTDAVDARVSFATADRVFGGLGVQADTTRPWWEGEVVLRGSVDVERILRGATTTTVVSGERLRAETTANSLLVGLNGVYRQGRGTVGAAVSARQELGSTDAEYVGFLNLGISF